MMGNSDSNTPRSSRSLSQITPYRSQDVLLQPPPVWSRIMIWTLGLGTVSLVTWSCLTQVDETISMNGQIETASPEAKVTSANEGLIQDILIRPYQTVQRGTPLYRLSINDINSSINGLTSKLLQLRKQRVVEQNLFKSKTAQLKFQVKLHQNVLDRLVKLLALGAAQEVQVMERQTSLQETINSMESLKEELAKSLNNLKIQEIETENLIRELSNNRSDMTVIAPVTGAVQNMRFNSPGERVQAGEEMATIVPNLQLLAAVSVPSRISAPVKVGQAARLSVDAFPSNDYGELDGQVVSISPTAISAESGEANSNYRATIAINRSLVPSRFPLAQLRPGMGVVAKVKLRKRAVITLVFDFLEKLVSPLTERR